MLKNVYYFIDERGFSPVKEYIEQLPLSEQAKVFAYIAELKQQGHNLRRPIAGYLGNGIYELRPRANRIFYFIFLRDSAVLLHALRKKTDEIPKNDLELCIKRKVLVEVYRKLEQI